MSAELLEVRCRMKVKNYSGKINISKTFYRSSVQIVYIKVSWLTNSINIGMSHVISLTSDTQELPNEMAEKY